MKSNKSTRSSSKSTSRSTGTKPGFGKMDVNKTTSTNIRQIENGFIISESGTKGKGKNQQYFNRDYYSPTNPVAGIKGSAIKFGKK